MTNVRIGFGKRFHRSGGSTRKQEHRAVHGVRERAAEHEFPARVCLPRQGQVFIPQRCPARKVIGDKILEQKVMHARSICW